MILRLCTFVIYLLLGCLLFEQVSTCIYAHDAVECNEVNTVEAEESIDVKGKDTYTSISLLEDALHSAFLGKCPNILFPNYRFKLLDCPQNLAYSTIFSPPPNPERA